MLECHQNSISCKEVNVSTAGREEKMLGPYVHKEKVLHEKNSS